MKMWLSENILKRNKAFPHYKNSKLRKGLVHGFGKKLAIFHLFLSNNIGQEKYILQYSRTKKRLFTLFGQKLAIFPSFF